MSSAPPRCALRGLLHRREVWAPTGRGWLALALGIAAFLTVLFFAAYPWLAVNDPHPGGAFVLEGWVGKTAIPAAVRAWREGGYTACYATGGALDEDSDLTGFATYAEVGAMRLHQQGVAEALAIPSQEVKKDRTYASALDLRTWFQAHGGVPGELTIFTHGVHARRSRLLFAKAFGGDVRIGVIAVPPRNYDPARWYTSSAGVREVIGEAIAYLYARLLFWPPNK